MNKHEAVLELVRIEREQRRLNRDFKKLGRVLDTLGITENVERVRIANVIGFCDETGVAYQGYGPGVAVPFWTPLHNDDQAGLG